MEKSHPRETAAQRLLEVWRDGSDTLVINKLSPAILKIDKDIKLTSVSGNSGLSDWSPAKAPADGKDESDKAYHEYFDYLIGIVDLEGSVFLMLVSKSEPVLNFDNLLIFKIKEIVFHQLKESTQNKDAISKLRITEESNRLTRLFTKHGYYARGANLSNCFTDSVKDFFGAPVEAGIGRSLMKGLAGFLDPKNLDRYRRKLYSANYSIVSCIEMTMKKQLWMFDVVLVSPDHRGLCRQGDDS